MKKISYGVIIVLGLIVMIGNLVKPGVSQEPIVEITHSISASNSWNYVPSSCMEAVYDQVSNNSNLQELTVNLVMTGLIDKYGESKTQPIKTLVFKSKDIVELRNYKNSTPFWMESNDYYRFVVDQIKNHPFVIKFWINSRD